MHVSVNAKGGSHLLDVLEWGGDDTRLPWRKIKDGQEEGHLSSSSTRLSIFIGPTLPGEVDEGIVGPDEVGSWTGHELPTRHEVGHCSWAGLATLDVDGL